MEGDRLGLGRAKATICGAGQWNALSIDVRYSPLTRREPIRLPARWGVIIIERPIHESRGRLAMAIDA